MYRCQPFDLDDQALIEGARITGRPEHVARAVEAAVRGFRCRMQHHPPLPIVNGEFVLRLVKQRNFFDDYCQDAGRSAFAGCNDGCQHADQGHPGEPGHDL